MCRMRNYVQLSSTLGCEHTIESGGNDADGVAANNDDLTCIMRGGGTGGTDTRFCQPCQGIIENRIHNDGACTRTGRGTGRNTCVSKSFVRLEHGVVLSAC